MSPVRRPPWILVAALAGSCLLEPPAIAETTPMALADLTASEELILKLTSPTKKLGESASALKLPNEDTAYLFAEMVEVNRLSGPQVDSMTSFSVAGTRRSVFAPDPGMRAVPRGELAVWSELFSTLSGFVETKFFPIKGRFLEATHTRFLCTSGLEALARTSAGGWQQIKAEMDLTWRVRPAGGWEIASWKTTALTVIATPQPFFSEALDAALPRPADLMRARYCQHEVNLIDFFTKDRMRIATNNPFYAEFIDLDSTFQHPSISAADVGGDGWDDLYLTQRWGRNMLLRNNHDGTFTDIAGTVGLDLKDFCNCSLFADFDNDGDQDVFVGRSLEPSIYMANEGGHFVDRTAAHIGTLPRLVASMAAADYNGDGLLDLYLCTYGPTAAGKPLDGWAGKLCSPEIAAEMGRRHSASHRYLDLLGPPNVLLKNVGGGKFMVAPESAQVADWHNTNQATWADFDDDGDPDLHVCNDFGPSTLYRNNGPKGFADVTAEIAGTAMQGFGMGGSWADYDGDGRLDLYVSNMFSKAGRRITAQIPGLDPRTPYSAEGSLLFHNVVGRFDQVAGTEPPAMLVAKVGWAFGGQFCDFDNDTWPDIFSASGFYTAPKEIAQEEDL